MTMLCQPSNTHRPPRRLGMLRRPPRRGYALMLVCLFVVMFLAMIGTAWRRVASVLRIEQVVETRRMTDEANIAALAQAIQVLETRLCQDTSNTTSIRVSDSEYYATTYTCRTGFDVSNVAANPEFRWCTVVFTKESNGTWSIGVTRATDAEILSLPLMPVDPP